MHDGPDGHHHDDDDPIAGYDDVILWNTAGFDVGSSTSQIVFSRVTLARDDTKYVIAQRDILHESEVILTPYRSHDVIDGERLAWFVSRQFEAANLTKDDIDAGAVILTGIALSAHNSRAIADAIADESGKFVAVSAGDMLEARLAASGAGIATLSKGVEGVLVHIDVGGGTTKLSAWSRGKLKSVAALDVGARLLLLDATGRVLRLDPQWMRVAADLGLDLRPGLPAGAATIERLCDALAEEVLRHAGVVPEPPKWPHLLRTPPLFRTRQGNARAVVFSGGVSEYVYEREPRTFGDVGLPLGSAFKRRVAERRIDLLPLARGIRATVLGVSQHSMQLSGNTVYVSDRNVLPLRNVPVLLPECDLRPAELSAERISRAIEDAAADIGIGPNASLAVAVRWHGSATYPRLRALARGISTTLDRLLRPAHPLIVIVDGDIAGVLGSHLSDEIGGARSIVCVDAVDVHEFDHIDIGQFAPRTQALPVIVKTLLFSQGAS
jgi:ethanolamine utilization protein EutA